MVKLVDMPDLGSGAARRVGSSPIIRTFKTSRYNYSILRFFFIFIILFLSEDFTDDFKRLITNYVR